MSQEYHRSARAIAQDLRKAAVDPVFGWDRDLILEAAAALETEPPAEGLRRVPEDFDDVARMLQSLEQRMLRSMERRMPPLPTRTEEMVGGLARRLSELRGNVDRMADELANLHTRCDDLRTRLERIEEERRADAVKTSRLRDDVDRLLAMVPSAARQTLGTEGGADA